MPVEEERAMPGDERTATDPEIYELFIPGHAARREFAVYLLLWWHHRTRQAGVYVGKVGDNREGCNPIVSRIGNHFSFNKVHSQTRNRVPKPHDHDFRVFYAYFGDYVPPQQSRAGIDLINEMERELNRRAVAALGGLVENPFKGKAYVPLAERARRKALVTPSRGRVLDAMVAAVAAHHQAVRESLLDPQAEPAGPSHV
jgi:hypothetical protein